MPPAKKLRPTEDSVIQTPAADVVSASSSIPDSQRKGQLPQSLSSSVPLPSHPQPTRASNEMKQTSRFKIPTKELLPSAEIELRDNELDPTSFPANGLILTEDWNPREEHANHGTSKSFLLENFSVLKNQTLVFKVTVPSESKRWSVNLGPPEMHTASSSDENWSNILYHFNPRYAAKRKEFVQCDMTDGMWGVTDRRPFSAYSVLPTGNHMLIIQVSILLPLCPLPHFPSFMNLLPTSTICRLELMGFTLPSMKCSFLSLNIVVQFLNIGVSPP